MRTPVPRRLTALLLPLLATLVLVSCGGGEDDAKELLDKAFSKEIQSADLSFDTEVDLKGVRGLDRPIRVEADGPFRDNEKKLPSADVEVSIDAGGQTVSTGFLSTGDRAFVKFQDVFYEQPRSEVQRTNEQIARNDRGGRSLQALGLDPRSWLKEAKEEGEENVAGVQTRHVSGKLDVRKLMNDVNSFVQRQGRRIAGAPQPLSDQDIEKVAEVVKDPTFDVYVGKDDDILRRVSGRLDFQVPEGDRRRLGGLEGGSVSFTIELKDVNGDQRIEAPARARPLSDLTQSLRGSGGLGGVAPEPQPTPQPQPGGSGGSGGSGGQTPDADSFRRYGECLERAKPEDTDALQRCAQLLE